MLVPVQHILRSQLDTLVVGGLLLLLILQFYSYLRNIIGNLGLVLQGEVDEEVVTCRTDMVHPSLHLVLLAVDVSDGSLGIEHSDSVAAHFSY